MRTDPSLIFARTARPHVGRVWRELADRRSARNGEGPAPSRVTLEALAALRRTPATRPTPARDEAETARRRSSRLLRGTLVRDRAPAFCRGSPVPTRAARTAAADRLRGLLGAVSLRSTAPPPASPRLDRRTPAPPRPAADLDAPDGAASPVGRASPKPRTVGTSIQQRHLALGAGEGPRKARRRGRREPPPPSRRAAERKRAGVGEGRGRANRRLLRVAGGAAGNGGRAAKRDPPAPLQLILSG